MTNAARSHYQAGRLGDAIAAATADVKARPGDPDGRGFLAELLCFAGTLERADLMLDVIGQQTPAMAVTLALFRQLIRAEQARQQVFAEGRLPELLEPAPAWLKAHLEALVLLREGNEGEAAARLAEAEAGYPVLSGRCDDRAFEGFRDLDDVSAPFFEVLTSTGKYYWIPMDRVVSIEFRAPTRPHHLLWRAAQMVVADGPDGEVYLPSLYPGSATAGDDQLRLGRATDWRGGEGGPVRGIGQRCFLAGEEAVSILEIGRLDFTTAA